jgi:hypothetical protein
MVVLTRQAVTSPRNIAVTSGIGAHISMGTLAMNARS